jgi:hypothetical protein
VKRVGDHSERAHSKYSASGAERWFSCPGSVALSEGLPDKSSIWADEGTLAHEVLEFFLKQRIGRDDWSDARFYEKPYTEEMRRHADKAVEFIYKKAEGNEILCEQKVYLDWIDPEAFGTFDSAILDYFGTLHVFDYKYGAGHSVSVRENLQMIFYGIGLAHLHHWNFKKVRLWIIQPRIRGYDGPVFWDVSILRLKGWVHLFRKAIERVKTEPETYFEGQHCWWCKAKKLCPLKREAKLKEAKSVFSIGGSA